MSNLNELLERVEKATGPDREIDEALMALVYVRDERHIGASMENDLGRDEPVKDRVWVDPKTDKWVSTHASQFTGSIDAALALVESVAGGEGTPSMVYSYDLNWCSSAHPDMAFVAELFLADGDPCVMTSYHAQSYTLPLAILAALLKALISQEQQK